MSATVRGYYPIERRSGEIERLHVQGAALAGDAARMLDLIGVAGGWRCLDLGCGPEGITDLLSARAGSSGEVVGLDADSVFIDHARLRAQQRLGSNLSFIVGDAYATGLPDGSFDLVHSRFLASTAREPEKLLQEAMRLTRPGGVLAFQEPDIETLHCIPAHPAWQRLRQVLGEIFPLVAGEDRLAHQLFGLLRRHGFEDVQYRPFLVGFRSDDPMVDYLPATAESVRGKIFELGLMTPADLEATLAACRAHLADPGTVSNFHTVIQVWGTAPALREAERAPG
jgi:SAM-dependent methyltransferase